MDVCIAGSGLDFVHGHLIGTETDIGPDCVGEQNGLLTDIGYLGSELFKRNLVNVAIPIK